MHLDRTTRRILGSLVEKRLSTPDQYPLTMNALVLACNQRSNRDPFTDLQEFEVQGCVLGLRQKELLTIVEREYGRVTRYRERLTEALALSDEEAALLAELLLRGPQTEQELARRCPRMVATLATPEAALSILTKFRERGLVEHLPRESGRRHARWRHRLVPPGEAEEPSSLSEEETTQVAAAEVSVASIPAQPVRAAAAPPGDDVAALRRAVDELREDVSRLRGEVAALRNPA